MATFAARGSGKAKTPQEMAGKATDESECSLATSKEDLFSISKRRDFRNEEGILTLGQQRHWLRSVWICLCVCKVVGVPWESVMKDKTEKSKIDGQNSPASVLVR